MSTITINSKGQVVEMLCEDFVMESVLGKRKERDNDPYQHCQYYNKKMGENINSNNNINRKEAEILAWCEAYLLKKRSMKLGVKK
jgi:hypothetical protein